MPNEVEVVLNVDTRSAYKSIEQFETEVDGFVQIAIPAIGRVMLALNPIKLVDLGISGVNAGVNAIGAITAETTALADRMDVLSQQTNFSVESLYELRGVSELVNADFNALAPAALNLQEELNNISLAEIGRGDIEAAERFARDLGDIGLAYSDLKNLSPENQFLKVADALSKVDESSRIFEARDILGVTSQNLLPLIDMGPGGIQQLMDFVGNSGFVPSPEQNQAFAGISENQSERNMAGQRFDQALTKEFEWFTNLKLGAETAFLNGISSVLEFNYLEKQGEFDLNERIIYRSGKDQRSILRSHGYYAPEPPITSFPQGYNDNYPQNKVYGISALPGDYFARDLSVIKPVISGDYFNRDFSVIDPIVTGDYFDDYPGASSITAPIFDHANEISVDLSGRPEIV